MLTRSQINRAGRRLRKAETPDEADRQIYDEFRATFAEPLAEVVEALRGVAGGAPVTYRLKRFETTVEKLRRLTSDLARLEDIAGCRVVVPTMREQRDTLGLIRQEFKVIRERDYQAEPRDGYRALHVVVHSQGKAVEVQLRTELEDRWANTVEEIADRHDRGIKYGGGAPGVRDILDTVSELFGEFDAAIATDHRFRDALTAIRDDPAKMQALLSRGGELDLVLTETHAFLGGRAREGATIMSDFLQGLEREFLAFNDAAVALAMLALREALGTSIGLAQSLKALTERLEAVAALGSDDSADAPEYSRLLEALEDLKELRGDA